MFFTSITGSVIAVSKTSVSGLVSKAIRSEESETTTNPVKAPFSTGTVSSTAYLKAVSSDTAATGNRAEIPNTVSRTSSG